MTKRKPLEWYDSELGAMPGCTRCCDLLFRPMFTEAVYSVSIEHPGSPEDLMRRTITQFHERRHPADMFGPEEES